MDLGAQEIMDNLMHSFKAATGITTPTTPPTSASLRGKFSLSMSPLSNSLT